MSLAPLMSPLDADTAVPPHSLPADSFTQAADQSIGRTDDRTFAAVAPADLVGLPTGGLERTEPEGSSPDISREVPFDLTQETNRDLRWWSNALYRVLDADFPPYGTIDNYERVIAELERRKAKDNQGSPSTLREKFRDNAFNHRFELFRNGLLAGYVNYTMRAGALRLHHTVITADFDGMGLEGVLMRHVILLAHKRRLTTVPYCPVAQNFLQKNPQYRQLIHAY
jgi:predicted GNAT family acetyltransferase